MATKPNAGVRALANMSATSLSKVMTEVNEAHDAADDANTVVASTYKKIKKMGINLDAFKVARKIDRLDNPAKQQAFLNDFDKIRELRGWDKQLKLFEEDQASQVEEVPHKDVTPEPTKKAANGKKPVKAKPGKETKPANGRVARGRAVVPVPKEVAPKGRKALFDEGDEEAPARVN